jgi:hypothetical protein
MVASTSTVVVDDGYRLRAVADRSTQEVKDYTLQYEDRYNLVEALGVNKNKPENMNVLDILTLREGRLEAARIWEAAALVALSIFLAAEKAALQAQATAAAAACAVSPTSATPTVTIDRKLMKRKLPEPRDRWKDA